MLRSAEAAGHRLIGSSTLRDSTVQAGLLSACMVAGPACAVQSLNRLDSLAFALKAEVQFQSVKNQDTGAC